MEDRFAQALGLLVEHMKRRCAPKRPVQFEFGIPQAFLDALGGSLESLRAHPQDCGRRLGVGHLAHTRVNSQVGRQPLHNSLVISRKSPVSQFASQRPAWTDHELVIAPRDVPIQGERDRLLGPSAPQPSTGVSGRGEDLHPHRPIRTHNRVINL